MNQSWANAGEPVTSRYVYTIILHVGTAMWFSACPASNVINPQVDDVASHIIHNYSCVGHAMWGFRWRFVRPWKGFLPSIQWVNILRHCFSMFPNSEKGDAEPPMKDAILNDLMTQLGIAAEGGTLYKIKKIRAATGSKDFFVNYWINQVLPNSKRLKEEQKSAERSCRRSATG